MLGAVGEYPLSALLYLFLLVVSILLAETAKRSGKFKSIGVLIIILTVVSAFRAPSVGVDTQNYVDAYEIAIPNYFEPGFRAYIELTAPLHSTQAYLGVIALVTYLFIFLRLWELKGYCDLTVSVAVFMLLYFHATWNGLRSYLVTAIIFYLTRYIQNRKYGRFLLACILCCTIHYSSVFFLPMVLTAFFGVKDLSRTEKKYLILKVLLAFAVVGAGMAAMISNGTFNRYLDEYTGAEFLRKEIGLSWCLYLVLLIIGIRYLFQRKAVVGKVLIKTDCMITTFVVAGTICTLASFFWMPIGRIASYYMIFNTIFISVTWIVSKSYRYGILYRISFASYCMYCFCSVIIENGQSTMPYLLY